MSRLEILNSGSLRLDGRLPLELRSISLHISPEAPLLGISSLPGTSIHRADGSARVDQGLTRVYASVYGPREAANRSNTLHDRAILEVEVSLEPWSGKDRRKRAKGDRRTGELAAAIKSTFEPVIHTHLFPRSQIDVFVSVEHQDGGVLSCAINAVTLALLDAGIACSDYVCSLAVGLHLSRSTTLLDLTSQEENSLPHLVIATLPRSGKITLAQLETRIHTTAVEEMMGAAVRACHVLQQEFDIAMRQRTKKLAQAMGGHVAVDGDEQRGDRQTDQTHAMDTDVY